MDQLEHLVSRDFIAEFAKLNQEKQAAQLGFESLEAKHTDLMNQAEQVEARIEVLTVELDHLKASIGVAEREKTTEQLHLAEVEKQRQGLELELETLGGSRLIDGALSNLGIFLAFELLYAHFSHISIVIMNLFFVMNGNIYFVPSQCVRVPV